VKDRGFSPACRL